MFDFIRKPALWKAWDDGLDQSIGKFGRFQLKSAQDLTILDQVKGLEGKTIAEVGGGDSRVLEYLSKKNSCFNIDKFEGHNNGPNEAPRIPNTINVYAFLGEQSEQLKESYFDVVFSISVVEHIVTEELQSFLEDGIRILKPGGLWLHAIDIYLEDEISDYCRKRYEAYRGWLNHSALVPTGKVHEADLKFECDMVTNPDDVMWSWGKIAPRLGPLRQHAQLVSVILSAQKRDG